MKNLFTKNYWAMKGLAMLVLVVMGGSVRGQTNNYFGTSGTINGNVWSTNSGGPYTSSLVTTGGPILNFNNAGSATGATVASIVGINFGAAITWTAGGTFGAAGINLPIAVASGISINFTPGFSTSATSAVTKNGLGELAIAGGTFGGGFTLNAGTLAAAGTNALGNGTLTINGGTISGTATRSFAAKFSGITIGGDFTLGATSGLSLSAAHLTFNSPMSIGSATRTITIGGTGTYSLGGIISGGSGSGLIINTVSTGNITLTAINTYTGNTTINGNLILSSSGSISTSPNIIIGSGGTFDVSSLTTPLSLVSSQTLKSSSTGSNTTGTITVASSKNLTLSSGGLAFTAYGGGATSPLTVTGASAGALALNSAPITVTTTSALAIGTYKLIAKSGSATGVSGTIGTLAINGSGLAANTTGALSISSGELLLTVTTIPTNNWTGATSTSWNNTGNWSLGTVPLSTDNITISSGSPILDVDYTLASGRTLTISGTGTLTINPTKILTIAGTADFGAKSVTLKSDASGTAAIGQITGTLSNASNVTVERYIPATRRAYRFLAAPVTTTGGVYASWQESGTNAAGLGIQVSGIASATGGVDDNTGLDKTLTGSSSMFSFDGSAWAAVTNTKTTQLTPGAGFRVLVRGDRLTDLYAASNPAATATTIKATGAIGQGTITLSSLVTGFNLLGNPYPSAIDWNASGWQAARNLTNVYDAIYIYDPANVASTSMTYPAYITGVGGTNGGSNIIRSGQAFFVEAAATASISFLEAYKSTTVTGGFFRSARPEMMRITYMQNNEHLDDIIINFNNDAQADFDPSFDARSMGGDEFGLASFKNAERLAIHTRPTAVGDDSVALSVRNTTTGNYQLKFSELEGFAASTDITLLDKFLNVQYDVKQDSVINFEITTDVNSKGDDRFWLFYNHKSTGINQQALAKNKINVYPNPASSVINLSLKLAANQKSTYTYNIYNQLGAMVQTGEVDFANGKQAQVNIDAFSAGVYFITASNGKDLQTIKFVK